MAGLARKSRSRGIYLGLCFIYAFLDVLRQKGGVDPNPLRRVEISRHVCEVFGSGVGLQDNIIESVDRFPMELRLPDE